MTPQDQPRAGEAELRRIAELVVGLDGIMKRAVSDQPGPNEIATPDGQRIRGVAADCIIQLAGTVSDLAARASAALSASTAMAGTWDLVATAALSAHPRGDDGAWRPISEAPQTGTHIWACNARGEQFECWWHEGRSDEQYWMDNGDSEPEPVHWMPLPSPPTPEETPDAT
jgi:hypothetical protein